ncbi:glycosyltransferase [Patulibacter brassicae]|uniref:Glycosyltransferase n=1 Tax=Patulibacter brassicae TaxID=1705717 RepID=A0ABU4VJY8_9ACTN|nr:glycosyltransferase [Patulibacter brassicae]MDX8151652.1 glycosyltransferase [Patulibacter brassicae]
MAPWNRERLRYMRNIARQGPTELGYAYFRARRRRKNQRDDETTLTESDELAISGAFDYSRDELAAHRAVVDAYRAMDTCEIRSIQWFLPYFAHAYFGGVYTILRFADHLHREHGVESRFCLYDASPDEPTISRLARQIHEAFPSLADAEVTGSKVDGQAQFGHLREADAAISTLWTGAYPLLRFNRVKAKLYFVQDYEPQFYPAGAGSALVEQTYRLGIPGIINTPGLAAAYRAYGNPAVSFVPAVDERYHPPATPRSGDGPVRIFFYGRPSTPRNAFGLGMATLAKVKQRYRDRVEIVSAGEEWRPGAYGVADVLTNVGRLPGLDAVSDLYRTCDVGLVFMFTKHPSYQPLEFMASGMATVSNENPDTAWFLHHERNSLVAPPAATIIAEEIGRLVEDAELRHRIAEEGRREMAALSWPGQFERIWETITHPAAATWDDPEGWRP